MEEVARHCDRGRQSQAGLDRSRRTRDILAEQAGPHYVAARLNSRIETLARKPNFARYLRDARIKRGLSVAEVADEVGVSAVEYLLLGD